MHTQATHTNQHTFYKVGTLPSHCLISLTERFANIHLPPSLKTDPLLLGPTGQHTGQGSVEVPLKRVCLNSSIHTFLSFKWLQVWESAEVSTQLSIWEPACAFEKMYRGFNAAAEWPAEKLMVELPVEN